MTVRSRSRTIRPSITALALCLALLAAACGSDSEPSSDAEQSSSTAPTTSPADDTEPDTTEPDDNDTPEPDEPLPASAPGVTSETITVGIALTDVDQFANIGDLTDTYQALADLTNEAGGVGGRLVEIHTERWPIIDLTAHQAACIALTEDIESFLVIGFLLDGFGGTDCYADTHETLVINTEGIGQDSIANAEGRLMTTAISDTDLAIAGIPLLADRIGGANVVVYAGSDPGPRMGAAVDALEAIGATVVEEAVQQISATEDLLAAENELDISVERWTTAGAEWVFNLDGSIAGSLAALQRAGRNDVGVVHAGTTVATLRALGADPSLTETLLAIGVTALEFLYVDGLYGTTECIDKVSERLGVTMEPFVEEGELDPLAVTIRACAAWNTFVLFAAAAGPELTTESFLQAGYDLGEFDLIGAPSGSLAPDKPFLGNGQPEVLVFDAEEDGFVPVS